MNLMDLPKKRGKWNLELCKRSAAQYKTRTAWSEGSKAAYSAAYRNGWLDQCCAHMQRVGVKWTYEKCVRSAARYKTRSEWNQACKSAYHAARKNGWVEDCCAHMLPSRTGKKWTFENCAKNAKKYNTRSDWQRGCSGAYNAANRNGWLDECCTHMKPIELKWDFAACLKSARAFRTRTEWISACKSAYQAARNRGWLDHCCAHMGAPRTQKKWTLDACIKSASEFKTRTAWQEGCSGAYFAAHRNGWMKKCCQHMRSARAKWTLKICKGSASYFSTKKDWLRCCRGAYNAAHRNGWLVECCSHMKRATSSRLSLNPTV
ncbi:hypothetical protein [Vibrio harveyi]